MKGRWNKTVKIRFKIAIDEKVTGKRKIEIGEDEAEESGEKLYG